MTKAQNADDMPAFQKAQIDRNNAVAEAVIARKLDGFDEDVFGLDLGSMYDYTPEEEQKILAANATLVDAKNANDTEAIKKATIDRKHAIAEVMVAHGWTSNYFSKNTSDDPFSGEYKNFSTDENKKIIVLNSEITTESDRMRYHLRKWPWETVDTKKLKALIAERNDTIKYYGDSKNLQFSAEAFKNAYKTAIEEHKTK
jgi:hypothetical protein